MIKRFYVEFYTFWLVSKIVLIVLFLLASLSLILEGGLRTNEFLYNFIILIEALLLGVSLISDFDLKINFNILKKIAGFLLTLFGLFLLIFLITLSNGSRSEYFMLGYPFSIWIIMIGIFEFLNIKKENESK